MFFQKEKEHLYSFFPPEKHQPTTFCHTRGTQFLSDDKRRRKSMIVHVAGANRVPRTENFLKGLGVRMDFFADWGYPGMYRVCCQEDILRLVSQVGPNDPNRLVLDFHIHGLNQWSRLPVVSEDHRKVFLNTWLRPYLPLWQIAENILKLQPPRILEGMPSIKVVAREKPEENWSDENVKNRQKQKKGKSLVCCPSRYEYSLVLSDDFLVKVLLLIPVRGFRQDFHRIIELFEQGVLDENLTIHALRELILCVPQDWDGPLIKDTFSQLKWPPLPTEVASTPSGQVPATSVPPDTGHP